MVELSAWYRPKHSANREHRVPGTQGEAACGFRLLGLVFRL